MNETHAAMYEFWKQWFAQPEAEKLKHLRQPGKGGYFPRGSESPGYTGKPDPKEYFHFRLGEGHPGSDARGDSPTDEVFDECLLKADAWMRERGLHGLIKAVRAEDCVLRIIHYFPTPDGAVGEAHRDFDLLTVSVPGTEPGLEIYKQLPGTACPTSGKIGCGCGERCRGDWHLQEEGIQVGEMLEIYTNPSGCKALCSGHLKATTHRVRTAPNTERFKAVFFYNPPLDFELRPGFTARDYLYGQNGALRKAGTADVGRAVADLAGAKP